MRKGLGLIVLVTRNSCALQTSSLLHPPRPCLFLKTRGDTQGVSHAHRRKKIHLLKPPRVKTNHHGSKTTTVRVEMAKLPTVNETRLRIEQRIASIQKTALQEDILAGRASLEEKQDTAAKTEQEDEELATPSPLPKIQIPYKQRLVHRWGESSRVMRALRMF